MILSVNHHQSHFGFTLAFVGLNQLGLYQMRLAGKMRRFFHFFVGGGEITRFSAAQRFVSETTRLPGVDDDTHYLFF